MATPTDKTALLGIATSTLPSGAGAGAIAPIALSLATLGDEAKFSTMWMQAISPIDGSTVCEPLQLQWMPETLTDSMEIGWTDKVIPGASASLQQWTHNGGRTWSFDLVMFRYMRRKEMMPRTLLIEDPEAAHNERFNVNIPYMIKWLRAMAMPTYKAGDFVSVTSPPFVQMCVPGLKLATDGTDIVTGVMKSCDVVYNKTFRDGEPRMVTVTLAIKEVVQRKQGDPIRMVGHGDAFGDPVKAGLAAVKGTYGKTWGGQ